MQSRNLDRREFDSYLRTGRIGIPSQIRTELQTKFNPYHDPADGRFTFGPGNLGGASTIGSMQSERSAHPGLRKTTSSPDPIGDLIERSLKRERTSSAQPRPISSDATRPKNEGLSHWPIAGASFRSLNQADKPGEGAPQHGAARGKGHHRGIDIKAPSGTAMRAADAGVIVRIVPNPSLSFGDQLVIYHSNGIFTHYAHLEHGSAIVRSGTRVAAGQTIARVGRTGNTPQGGDSHLHFEVRLGSSAPAAVGGQTRDPLVYLPR